MTATAARSPLRVIDTDPAGVLAALGAALRGEGAIAPVPPGPDRYRSHTLAAIRAESGVPRDDADPVAVVMATSGSTGAPRGVLLGAAALLASADATHRRLGGPGHWLLALPASHIAGLQVLVRSATAHTTPAVVDQSSSFTAQRFAAAAATLPPTERRYTALVPTQVLRLLDDAEATASLQSFDAVLVGGAAMSATLRARATAVGIRLVSTYGMTETSGGCVYDGVPLDGVHIRCDDDASIAVRGAVLARGYRGLGGEVALSSDGWLRTQDLGTWSGGRLDVLGRRDDVAISGGVNVPLGAVEEAMLSHPGIREAACVGVPDGEWGQRIVALIVPVDGAHPPTVDDVRKHLGASVPRSWAPRDVTVGEGLPLMPSGKIDRRRVAEQVARHLNREGHLP